MRLVARGMASDKTHVIGVAREHIEDLVQFGVSYKGGRTPVMAVCGTLVRGRSGWVAMKPPTKVRCAQCKRLTHIARAGAENNPYV